MQKSHSSSFLLVNAANLYDELKLVMKNLNLEIFHPHMKFPISWISTELLDFGREK